MRLKDSARGCAGLNTCRPLNAKYSPSMRIVTLVLCAAVIGAVQDNRVQSIAFVGGTVVDVSAFGSGTADIRDSVVIVQNGRITAVGTRRATTIPRDAEVIDAKGKFIVPGLHDVFATIDNQAYANAFLYMGVTAIVANQATNSRSDALFTSGVPSPRIYKMANVQGYDGTGITPAPRTIPELMARGRKMDPAELTTRVDELASSGVKVLLLHYALLPDQLRMVAAHARHIGLATIGELGATTYPEAIGAGVRAFVHTSRYSLELAPADVRAKVAAAPFGPPRIPYYEYLASLKDDDPALARYAATLGASGVMLIPTLSLSYLDLPGHRNPWTEPAARLLDPADLHLPADPKTGERPVSANPARDGFPPGFGENVQVIEARYCKAGARYLAGTGTDALGTMPGISLHTELELLVKACLTPRQALAAATANVGTAFDWRDVGQIRAGYHADLLVLDADPTADIANVKRIDRLMVAGVLIDRAALLRAGK
jgi:Amidohydrolase family